MFIYVEKSNFSTFFTLFLQKFNYISSISSKKISNKQFKKRKILRASFEFRVLIPNTFGIKTRNSKLENTEGSKKILRLQFCVKLKEIRNCLDAFVEIKQAVMFIRRVQGVRI